MATVDLATDEISEATLKSPRVHAARSCRLIGRTKSTRTGSAWQGSAKVITDGAQSGKSQF